jgi:site-specific DNA-methyltransferase (adenine-specific)
MKPYYEDTRSGITIYHGDCREILPGLGRFDLLLTDPPYGVAVDTENNVRTGGKWAVRHDYPPVAGDDGPYDPAPVLAAATSAVLWGANNYASRLPDSLFWLAWDRLTDGTTSTHLELAWVLGLDFRSVRVFRHQWCGVRRASEAGRRPLHPTQKPVALMSWCLGFFPDAKTVVDPYMGSGPVAKACKDRGLGYVGIELVEKYCEVAAKRLAQEVLLA